MERIASRSCFFGGLGNAVPRGAEYFRLRYAYAVMFGLLALECLSRIVMTAFLGYGDIRGFFWWTGIVPVVVLWAIHVPLWAVISRKPEPTKWIFQTYRDNLMWFVSVGVLLAFTWVKIDNVATIKNAIPLMVPYYADPFFAELDRAIFFTDPWKITHAVIPDWGTPLIERVYAIWHLLQVAFGCWMVFTRNLRLQVTALIAFTASWLLLGGVVATLFSSVGPCFYEHFYGDPYFRPLLAQLENAPITQRGFKFLIDTYQTGAYAGGISAFPSLHVAIAVWEVLVLRMAFRNRFVTAAGVVYATVIFIGSVHLGWHYAIDGIFSAAATLLLWKASARLVEKSVLFNERRPSPQTLG